MRNVNKRNPSTKIKKILITAGPTREMLDPVRYITNRSTGAMGYTLARIARRLGYQVTLVSGPTSLKPPRGVRFFSVVSAYEMERICRKLFPKHHAILMTAAVGDFTPVQRIRRKIKRQPKYVLRLRKTPDIISELGCQKGQRIIIGFSLETQNWLSNARRKLMAKGIDGVVANYLNGENVPFGDRRITVGFLSKGQPPKMIRNATKVQVAKDLFKWLKELQSG